MRNPFKRHPKADEQIAEESRKNLDRAIQRSASLERLIKAEVTGWKEFSELLREYIDACKQRKLATALDRADDKTIYELKLLDHEIFILNFVLSIPEQFIGRVKSKLEEQNGN